MVAWSKARPITAAACATSLTGCSRSSRAISESCRRGRDREAAQRAVEVVRIGRLAQRARFEHRLGHLLDEQRHAVGPGGDLVEQRLGQPLAAGDARDDALHRRARQPVQRGGSRPGGWRRRPRMSVARSPRPAPRCPAPGPAPARASPGWWGRSSARPRPPTAPAAARRARSAGRPGRPGCGAALLRRQRQRPVPVGRVQIQAAPPAARPPRDVAVGPRPSSPSSLPSRRSGSSSAVDAGRVGEMVDQRGAAPSRRGRASIGSGSGNAARRPRPRSGPQ